MELLHQEWFNALESRHKSVAGLYPWYALFCGSKGKNPFAGGDYAEDRTLFSAAGINALCSILASKVLKFTTDDIVFNGKEAELVDLINSVKPEHQSRFTINNLEFYTRIKFIVDKLNLLLPKIWNNPSEVETKTNESIKSIIEDVNDAKSDNDIDVIVDGIKKDIGSSSWLAYNERMNSVVQCIEDANPHP